MTKTIAEQVRELRIEKGLDPDTGEPILDGKDSTGEADGGTDKPDPDTKEKKHKGKKNESTGTT